MSVDEIVAALKASAKPYETFYIADDVRQAMMNLPNPGELVEPILDIIGSNPTVDFGAPGDLVHYVECFSDRGYEELLIESVKRTPTPHNIWMLHRCFNSPSDPRHDLYKQVAETLKAADSTPDTVKAEIDSYTW